MKRKSSTPNKIGKRGRAIREARGLSQREVADRCGVDELTVWRWEHEYDPPPRKYEAYAAALECEEGDLHKPIDAPVPRRKKKALAPARRTIRSGSVPCTAQIAAAPWAVDIALLLSDNRLVLIETKHARR